ncbi:MAG: hypothetical protein CMP07_03345 [Xanthomonadales bacterium]|nr:hypothetical protein [Xanthomonadales bacterium]
MSKLHARLTPARRRLLDTLLDDLLDRESGERRRLLAGIEQRCPRLHSRLSALVEASAEPAQYLETLFQRAGRAAFSEIDRNDVALPAGTRIGPWRLVEPVGSGGMGMVYRAERADGAFEMEAAVKLIRLRRDSRLKQRLEVERQLLARLDHPNIARILDGGETEDGQTYLVMDWVPGEDLTDCAGVARHDTGRCLDAFAQVADAVGHAHQRRVVHGDIKPANIRVTPEGRVRLLDFGVARLLAEEDVDETGFHALTPAFSAPEQIAGEPASTQSDVYALGVLLYWMLTGEVGNPDTDWSGTLSGRYSRSLDLAAIIARACAPDPADRYAGVSALVKDVERYRELQPVAARPPSRSYLLQRFVQRNPVGVGLGGVAMLLLMIGLVGTGWQARIAGMERDRAEAQRDLARLEADKTERVSEFLVSLFDQADPYRHPGRDLSARDLVRQGVEQVETLREAPLVQAEMFHALARVNRSLAEYESAREMASRALDILQRTPGVPDAERAAAWTLLGGTLGSLGRYREALDAHENALSLSDPEDPATVAEALDNIGLSLYSLGRFEAAERRFRRVLELRRESLPETADLASAHNNLALALAGLDRREEAVEHYTTALEIRRRVLGDSHPDTTFSLTNLATLLTQMGDYERAEAMYLEALAQRRQAFETGHPAVASVIYQLGWLNSNRNRWTHAEQYHREALALRQSRMGPDHPSVGVSLNALAATLRKQGRFEEARALLEQALSNYRAAYGESHHDIALVLSNLAGVHSDLGEYATAEALYAQALEMCRRELGENHRHVADILTGQAELALKRGRSGEAHSRALSARRIIVGVHADPAHQEVVAVDDLIGRIESAR